MKIRIINFLGKVAYIVSYPLLVIYLRIGKRTRVVISYKEEILLLKGWLGNDDWALPGGGLHYREEPSKGAVREVYEETGIKINAKSLKNIGEFQIKHGLAKIDYCLFSISLESKPKTIMQKHEIKDLAWISVNELASYKVNPDAMEAIGHWRQMLASDTIK